MQISDRFVAQAFPNRETRPLRPRSKAEVSPEDRVHVSLTGNCPTGVQRARGLCKQGRALGELSALQHGGAAQVGAALNLEQFRQGLCPYLAQAIKSSEGDWSALEALRLGLAEQSLDTVDFLQSAHEHYGPSFQVGSLLFESRPEVVQRILVQTERNYAKSEFLKQAMEPLWGAHNLFIAQGQEWQSLRSQLQPYFVGDQVMSPEVHGRLQAITAKHLQSLPLDQPLDLNQVFRRLTLDMGLQHLFQVEFTPEELQSSSELLAEAARVTQARLLGIAAPEPSLPLTSLAEQLLERGQGELLEGLKASLGDDPQRLQQEVVNLALLAHETTANLITWAVAELVQHPEQLSQLRQEYAQQVAPADALEPPSYKQTQKLNQLKEVLRETARVHNPNYLLSRETLSDQKIGDLQVAQGTQILMSLHETHRQTEPDRKLAWQPQGEGSKMYSFGGGPRVCLGQVLARLEAAVVVSQLFQYFDLEPLPDNSLEPRSDLANRPQQAYFRLSPRATLPTASEIGQRPQQQGSGQ